MKKRKICVVTGTRAEYGLLYPIIKKIDADPSLELQLIVTGMHLSPEFGLTYKNIEKEFKITKKIEMLLSSDTHVGISKSIGLATISFSEAFEDLRPDLILLLGDRYEIFAAATSAMIANIPIAHLYGGETTEGAFDEAIRHSITKMSHLHFVSTEEYKKRVIQLGEAPDRVYNVGAIGIENIKNMTLLNKNQFEESIEMKLNKKNILITYHPSTLEHQNTKHEFQEILNALEQLQDTNLIFTKANSDTNGRIINQMIDEYVQQHSSKAIGFTSLGQLRYLSSLQFMDLVLGNSSSGILEVPSFNIPTINIGDRQKGRAKAKSVIDVNADKQSILESIDLAFSKQFTTDIQTQTNPYSSINTSDQIIDKIKSISLENILKKSFYNL